MKCTGRKGWQASKKDIIDLDWCMSPILLAWFKKFKVYGS